MIQRWHLAQALCLSIGVVASCLSFSSQSRGQASDQAEFFEVKIRPVLSSPCYSCHTGLKSGGLQLDSRENLLKGGNEGVVIIPGRPDESLLLKAISHTDDRFKMPLNGAKLDDETIANFAKWVRDGAVWPESPKEFFDARVRAILSNNCFACHSVSP